MRKPTRTVVVAVAAVAVLAGAAVGAYAATDDGGPSYRTATVTRGQVATTLTATGTASPATRQTAAFATSGKVASVAVTVGQQVTAGQQLAKLDTTSLSQALAEAQSTLAQARLTLEQHETGQSGTGSEDTGGSGGSIGTASASAAVVTASPPSSGRSTGSSSDSDQSGTGQISALQQAVVQAQQELDAALTQAQAALVFAQSSCATGSSTQPSATASPTAPSTGGGSTDTGPGSTACLNALHHVSSLQSAIADQEKSLATTEKQLDAALSALQSQTSASSRSGSGSAGTGRTSTTSVASAATLAADQAKIDADVAAVALAQQNLSQATLTSLINGTVLAVNLAAGQSVTAGSSTATVIIAQPSGYTVGIDVDVTDLPQLQVGQHATVSPDGGDGALTGTVAKIGVAPTTTGGTSYAVTIAVDGPTTGLRDGSTAAISIATATVQNAISVPVSAVSSTETGHFVQVLTHGKAVRTVVTIGRQSDERVVITHGLSAGQQVILADLKTPLPSSGNTGITRGGLLGRGGSGAGVGSGFGGGFPAGGFGGGFPGGGFGAGTR